jgi:hypothetical protein
MSEDIMPPAAPYNQGLEFQNDWGSGLQGVWIAYVSGSEDPVYFDCFEAIADGTTIKVGKINPRKSHGDYWTVTILDSSNQLWGTEWKEKVNLPNVNNEVIQIEAEGKSKEIQIVSSKGSTSLSLTRL